MGLIPQGLWDGVECLKSAVATKRTDEIQQRPFGPVTSAARSQDVQRLCVVEPVNLVGPGCDFAVIESQAAS